VDERLDAVRRLWATYREEGVDPAIALLDPEVEFVDHRGRRFLGHEGVREFFDEFAERGEAFKASPYTFELHEPDLIVIGHRRIRGEEGLVRGEYLYFVHSCRGGRVCRIAHLSKEAALAEIDERASAD
jgi:hypothetical protein